MLQHARRHSAVSCAKMAEPIEMRFGCGLWWTEGSMCYMEDTLAPPGEYD